MANQWIKGHPDNNELMAVWDRDEETQARWTGYYWTGQDGKQLPFVTHYHELPKSDVARDATSPTAGQEGG